MKRILLLAFLAGCGQAADAPARTFVPTAYTDTPDRAATDRLAALVPIDPDCHSAGVEALTLTDGDDTIFASVAQGVVVVGPGPRDRVLARAPIAECGGSGDAMVSLSIGKSSSGARVIVAVATIGGHREAETVVATFALRDDHSLERLP
ncbi:MAG TPA: hypothetical protein VL463_23920 [Kofleriaceae bacterium]|nr:hypothetical protein [Kofleriaceae bacterium]